MRTLLFIIGWLAVALGALGVALPLLPTTPFLLLAVACFARSSDRSRQWLMESRHFGPILANYLEHRVLPRRAKWLALGLLWPSVGWTATQLVPLPAVSVGLLLLALAISVYLLMLPSRPRHG
ncbi:MAG: YbaN family protein [Gammaproteobacteria bacterium]|nr:YbaN family protein [Gammaproteobacteria bacterium]